MATICDRCKTQTTVTTMSKFNRDTLCMQCKEDEKQAPGFKFAEESEIRECKAGNYNYPGVGLSPVDDAYLVALRAERDKTSVA